MARLASAQVCIFRYNFKYLPLSPWGNNHTEVGPPCERVQTKEPWSADTASDPCKKHGWTQVGPKSCGSLNIHGPYEGVMIPGQTQNLSMKGVLKL